MYEIIIHYPKGASGGVYRKTLRECFEFLVEREKDPLDGWNHIEIKSGVTPLSDAESASLAGYPNYFR
jgi:hypothetical protein